MQQHHYFGRNLDLEGSFGEGVVIVPRGYRFRFRHMPEASGVAIIGIAIVQEGYPLFYDAVNEFGLGMAGLNFPKSAVYLPIKEGEANIAPFEFIPYVLTHCKNLEEVRALLKGVRLAAINFSPQFPATPLHFMVSDKTGSLVVEPTSEGLQVYENPVNVLTNNPPFPVQLTRLNDYLNLSPYEAENRFSSAVALERYSRGMGAMGLPGDWSSASRFVRAAFMRANIVAGEGEGVNAFFHMLAGVVMPRGCVRLKEGVYEETVYSCCCDTARGDYYYTTYSNPTPRLVSLRSAPLDGEELSFTRL